VEASVTSQNTDVLSNAFATLGLNTSADRQMVRDAYRDLVQVWHPDRFSHNARLRKRAEEKLKSINNSYELLELYFTGKWAPPVEEPPQSPVGESAPSHTFLFEFYNFYESISLNQKALAGGGLLLLILWLIGHFHGGKADPTTLTGFELRIDRGAFSHDFLISNNSYYDLIDVHVTITVALEDGSRPQFARFWETWKFAETKKVNIAAGPALQVIEMMGTCNLSIGGIAYIKNSWSANLTKTPP
jgi:hypothetical protein